MTDRMRTRFLIIGSGVAGLHTAWRASQTDDVLVVTKRSLFDSATAYAQGGIAAALGAGATGLGAAAGAFFATAFFGVADCFSLDRARPRAFCRWAAGRIWSSSARVVLAAFRPWSAALLT